MADYYNQYNQGSNMPNANAAENLNSAYSSAKKMNRQTLFFWLIILVALIFIPQLNIFGDKTTSSLVFSQEGVEITMPDDASTVYTIDFTKVTEIHYYESIDYGTCIEGDTSGKCVYGTWENELFGQYIRCTSNRFDSCLAMCADGTWYVVNYESDNTTAELLEALVREFDSQGITVIHD